MNKQDDMLLNLINAARRLREGASYNPKKDMKSLLSIAQKLNSKEISK